MGGSYLHWGVIQISVTNLAVIVTMLVLFLLAITIPFGTSSHDDDRQDAP